MLLGLQEDQLVFGSIQTKHGIIASNCVFKYEVVPINGEMCLFARQNCGVIDVI